MAADPDVSAVLPGHRASLSKALATEVSGAFKAEEYIIHKFSQGSQAQAQGGAHFLGLDRKEFRLVNIRAEASQLLDVAGKCGVARSACGCGEAVNYGIPTRYGENTAINLT